MGSRLTVFPRAAWATLRGLGRDADVVLEVVNGIAFFTPLWRWLRKPRVAARPPRPPGALRHGARASSGAVAAFAARARPAALPLPRRPGPDDLESSREALVELGIAARAHPRRLPRRGAGAASPARARARAPRCSTSGRLKRYKRIELLLDVADARPGRDARHRGRRRPPRGARGRDRASAGSTTASSSTATSTRREKARLLRRGVGRPDRVLGRGLVPDRDGGRGVRARRARRCASAGWPSRSSTARPACSPTRRTSSPTQVAALVRDARAPATRMGDAALARARGFTWDRTASGTLDGADARRSRPDGRGCATPCGARRPGRRPGWPRRRWPTTRIQLVFTVVFTRLLGANGYGSLAALVSAFLILLVAGPVACRWPPRARPRSAASATRRRCARRCARGRSGCSSRCVVADGRSRCCCASRSPR